MTEAEKIIRELPTAILRWFDFRRGARTLYIGEITDSMAEMLSWDKKLEIVVTSLEMLEDLEGTFLYIVCISTLERYASPDKALLCMRNLLSSDGVLFLGMNNRFGVRYFCGDRDPYTDQNFDGIENYHHIYSKANDTFWGRMYNREELERLLRDAGFRSKFYSVLPTLENPRFLYVKDYIIREDFCNRVKPLYFHPKTVFIEEEKLYQPLMDNDMFHAMANAYLIECTTNGAFSDVMHVTNSLERGKERATMTIIHGDSKVIKKAAFPEGHNHIRKMAECMDKLRSGGTHVVDGVLRKDVFVMPYLSAETGQVYLRKLLERDKQAFFRAMDCFRDTILASSDTFEGCYKPTQLLGEPFSIHKDEWPEHDEKMLLLRYAWLDMVPLNSFYVDGHFVFYDQEFIEECFPAKFILKRMVSSLYSGNQLLENILPARELYARYGVLKELDFWNRLEWEFLSILRKERELSAYHAKHRCSADVINDNRLKLNYTVDEYNRLFVDVFANVGSRKLVLFGSGRFARLFFELYGEDYPVYAIVDNNHERWGNTLAGVSIRSPESLLQMVQGEYKVLICIKNYFPIMKQLDVWGITEYSVFNPDQTYPCKRRPIPRIERTTTSKKFHVGYIAGVFDLFHIGHLNLFRRAKEQCDYLIVGVVSDRGVTERKKVELFVPFRERVEMVRACRYVDEVVEIPFVRCGTEDAWRMYHFDVQFSGSDYEHNPSWLKKKAFLEEHGATMVFFPYTESTSSTKLKKLIEKKLL